jgi:hypothetical protein
VSLLLPSVSFNPAATIYVSKVIAVFEASRAIVSKCQQRTLRKATVSLLARHGAQLL